jgi:hypothetical protein
MPDKAHSTKVTDKTTNQHRHRADLPARQSPTALTEQADPLALQRAIADPGAASPRDILVLQRLAGNRALTRLIQSFGKLRMQTKLTAGLAGDKYEQEADRVAEQVVSGQPSPVGSQTSNALAPAPTMGGFAVRSGASAGVNRQAEEEEEVQTKPLAASITPLVQRQAEDEEELQTKPLAASITPLVQRQAEEEEEEVQTKSNLPRPAPACRPGQASAGQGGQPPTSNFQLATSNPQAGFEAGPDVESRLAAHKGGGSPLPDEVRAAMEPPFGADFSGVRVHTGGEADDLNRQLSAQAFTHGHDIYMAAGKYAPGTVAGNRLLAHELTHVIQQGSAVKRAGGSGGSMPSGRLRSTSTVQIQARPADIQRTPGEVTGVDWDTAENVEPSEGGAMGGVMRVTIGRTVHILKAIDSGAGTKFGEAVLKHIGGATTTESQLVPAKTGAEGPSIIAMLAKFKDEATNPYLKKHSDSVPTWKTKYKPRWDLNYPKFAGAKYLALQTNMVALGGVEMEEIWHDPERAKSLINPTLLHNLGRAMAADTLIGNADRFENMNTGNAFVMAHQMIGAIDTSTILQNYDAFVNQVTTGQVAPWMMSDINRDPAAAWVNFITQAGTELGHGLLAAPSSRLPRMLATFDRWFKFSFRDPLYEKITGVIGVPPEKERLWLPVKRYIEEGFQEGMAKVDQLLTGQKYKDLKVGFKTQEAIYGPDANFDWRAFKARRTYILTLRSGKSVEEAQQNATALAKYMFEWKPQVHSLARFDPALATVPNRPPALTTVEKLKRFKLLGRPQEEEEAERLKKQARAGQVDPDLLDKVKNANAGRRKEKALFEVQYHCFMVSIRQRAAALGNLTQELNTDRGVATGNGPQAELAQKKLDFVGTLKGSFAAMGDNYATTVTQWIAKLDPKKKKGRDARYRRALTEASTELQNKNAPFR